MVTFEVLRSIDMFAAAAPAVPAVAAAPAVAAYEPVQKHKVTPGIPG